MLAVGMLGAAGCYSYYKVPLRGKPVTTAELDKIIRGVSTKQDVRALLGKPDRMSVGDALSSLWDYSYAPGGRSEVDMLDGKTAYRKWTHVTIEFTLEGVVKDYSVTKTEEKLDEMDKQNGKRLEAI